MAEVSRAEFFARLRDALGPAVITEESLRLSGPVMTLRDHFAGLALNGMTSQSGVRYGPDFANKMAATSYALADAMLAERSKGQ